MADADTSWLTLLSNIADNPALPDAVSSAVELAVNHDGRAAGDACIHALLPVQHSSREHLGASLDYMRKRMRRLVSFLRKVLHQVQELGSDAQTPAPAQLLCAHHRCLAARRS
jgi:hypothetical protein